MGLLIFLQVVVVAFIVLVVWTVRAGYGRLLAGIFLAPLGLAVLLSLTQIHGLLHITIATALALVLLGLPIWWLAQWVARRVGGLS